MYSSCLSIRNLYNLLCRYVCANFFDRFIPYCRIRCIASPLKRSLPILLHILQIYVFLLRLWNSSRVAPWSILYS
ncbi:hypothetical protein BCR43DRAFT_298938 [Syncephalastrum racemosum]|uniref:Uncharacterized protein n=1 Tax=Syncephalastrum racemosum TaxID=13706 RepID=A0A1X2H9L8_SYNRA|nr:hypothetical protein BCR43DRAFT_298938 [Syncephalastrum racemosum]